MGRVPKALKAILNWLGTRPEFGTIHRPVSESWPGRGTSDRPVGGEMTSSPSSKISGPNPVFEESELVFGLVGPVGTNFDRFVHPLRRELNEFDYELHEVRISSLFKNFELKEPPSLEGSEEFQRLNKGMHQGNALRLASKKGEFLALAAAKAIHECRPREDRGVDPIDRVLKRTVHVIRSLKHPDEVRALRRIYGEGFYLIAVTAPQAQRRDFLINAQGCSPEEVDQLLKRDEYEEDEQFFGEDGENYGQRTRDTYHLADVFLPLKDKEELSRFVGLVFGDPFKTPTQDEHAMFMAFASGLRSADLSRQVGAVIVSEGGDLIASGANDVPRAGGGLYWPTCEDQRDHIWKYDSNARRRDQIIEDLLTRLAPKDNPEEWVVEGKKKLKASDIMDITEYGRAVHAEMEALMSCARSATSPLGGTLYSTTFPCHNCAKHIVAAGVRRVVYVEPYPKSQVKELFKDSIRLHDQPASEGDIGVAFEQFKGVGPKRFFDLFSMTLSWGTKMKRKKGGAKQNWSPSFSTVRVPMLPNSYINRETAAIHELLELTAEKESTDV